MKKFFRLGTRGSPLSLLQADEVRNFIASSQPAGGFDIEIVPLVTSGDWRPEHKEQPLRDSGGKELFTREIETALLEERIDIAVHSLKDLACDLPRGLALGAVLPRIDARDAFISRKAASLGDLPEGAVVGTSSLRRQAQILARRPDLHVVPMRGNVETRLKKLEDGMADAVILALAGLSRLGLQRLATSVFDPDAMLPAAGQGALAVEIRAGDAEARGLLAPIHSGETAACVGAERALLRALGATCHMPVGAFAWFTEPGRIMLEAMAARPDGTGAVRLNEACGAGDAEEAGRALGLRMKDRLPAGFFAA